MVNCFSGKINQVFMNIIANAIDASTEKGKVIITTKIENDNAIILIEDNGMGMSEETQAKIFDPFFTTKDVGSGTGLGLSITYGIIESHNGKIDVKSEVGKGTEFIITLPINN
jgi:signal transduction histidine kinase